ncbi:ABC transporter permease subunit [Singulisphaera sp. Ch08]|uniref:ABC transporter permease subunit n=1 Tax=Singulisphaera sp. Ch08 TaxID=3120278 RepID=A0AAU7CP84_9BACT
MNPILERELILQTRRETVFIDRFVAIAFAFSVILCAGWIWDLKGWDRHSLAGVSGFAYTLFVLTIAVLWYVIIGLVTCPISRAIARERDRKTLDAILTTRLSAAEIVLGTLAAGLVRWANGTATLVPVAVLLILYGGVDPRLIMLAGAGLASTAFAMAAMAVVASIVARTSRGAIALAFSMFCLWIILPVFVLIVKPRLWPSGPAWIVQFARGMLSSSPFGILANLSGMVRLGSPIEAIWRMIGLELIGGLLLITWAIWQLRPRSRAHYDDETRIAGLRILRATKWRLPRPPCGDDPVLWNAIYSNRTASRFARFVGHVINIGWIGSFVVVMAWFAVPAFKELAERGYGVAREAFTMPEINPFARVLVEILSGLTAGPMPGQARLEFNLALRCCTACFSAFYGCAMFAGVLESMWEERERDTWSGLIATPLSGWEIVRAKMLGSFVKSRAALGLMVALWVVGTIAGSIHPLGFVAAMVGIMVTGSFSAATGVYACLMTRGGREKMNLRAVLPYLLYLCVVAIVLPGRWSVFVAAVSPPFLAFSSLFTYEDIHAIVSGSVSPSYASPTSYQPGLEARLLLALWLISTLVQATGALVLMRAMSRGFDEAVGRPTRPRLMASTPSSLDVEGPSAAIRAGRDG